MKNLVAAAVLLAVVLVGYGGLYAVVLGKNKAVSQASADLEFALAREGQLRNIKHIVQTTEEQRAALDTYFIEPEGTVAFLERLETLGSSAGLELGITSVTIEPISSIDPRPATAQHLELLRVTLAADGNWRSVYHFLALLESLPFFIDVSQATIRATKPVEGAAPSWSLSVTASVAKQK